MGGVPPHPAPGGAEACPRSSRPHLGGGGQPSPVGAVLSATGALTVSEEVGGGAQGPRGEVPGQLLQLPQQDFHFCLQVLHRLLHRLEQERWERRVGGRGAGGRRTRAQAWCQVWLHQPRPKGHLAAQWGAAGRERALGDPSPPCSGSAPGGL